MSIDLGPLERIPLGEGRTFIVDGVAIAVFRTRLGEVYATEAACPHRGGPLADGLVGPTSVICPLHSYRFDLRTGASLGGHCASLRTRAVAITPAGRIILALARDQGAVAA